MTEGPERGASGASPTEGEIGPTTLDDFLGGRVVVEQPAKGRHRAGLDAVYLAAAVPDTIRDHVIDLGAGVGTAGLCVAARIPAVTVTLVDIDPLALALAARSLRLPQNAAFADRVRVLAADICAPGARRHAAGLTPGSADHVILNPPYYTDGRFRASPSDARAAAHVLTSDGLEPWIRTATDVTREGGTLTAIFRADGLGEFLQVLGRRFGAVDVIPLRPRPDAAATRVLLRAVRASGAPLRLLPGFVLHEGTGSEFTAEARGIMRDGKGLVIPGR